MYEYRAPSADMLFVLFDVFEVDALWQTLSGMGDVDQETARAILDEAARLCNEVIAPLNRIGDEQGCRLEQGRVRTPAGFREAYRQYCEGGWSGLGGAPEYGGMGMPKSLAAAAEEMLQGACMAFGLAPMLTAGACLAIESHGSDVLKALYLPRLYSGDWSASMDLTEAGAGTDLGLVRTMARPVDGDRWAITGEKLFITWGEHDMTDNIVHLVLARTPDAPAGVRGISMFLVPKYLPDGSGNPGQRNSLQCRAIEEKMGIHGSATCVMTFDDAYGWLLGEIHQGLPNMFTMMNYERLVVGVQAVGVAEASWQTASAYARDRLQGRGINSQSVADPLLVHPDVRRMLLDMKAYTEASRAFYIYVARYLDTVKYSTDAATRKVAENMVALLTPIAKAFMTDMAFEAGVAGQQVLGGHGYIRDWGQEQRVRDLRITQIYEGTNGVQAMDLIGRKTVQCRGELLHALTDDVSRFIREQAQALSDLKFGKPLEDAVVLLQETTDWILAETDRDPALPGAAGYDYLRLMGHVIYAYMWARMACKAKEKSDRAFYSAKLKTARYYFARHLPVIHLHAARIRQGSQVVTDLADNEFSPTIS